MRKELESAYLLARNLPAADLPEFLGQLEAIRMTAFARLAIGASAPPAPDTLLNVSEAAKRLHCSPDYLYRHSGKLPFTRRMGSKLLFSSVGIDAYLRKARP